MPVEAPITFWHWAGFIFLILVLLTLDLGLLHRSARRVNPKEAVAWTAGWVILALAFARGLAAWRGPEESLEFLTGYFIEYSLSIDNLIAIALIFSYFSVAPPQQHRVLIWGILGAVAMRGLMIGAGVVLIQTFRWTLYILGAFLVCTGVRWAFAKQSAAQPEKNFVMRLARKILPISNGYDGCKFLTSENGRRVWTPLALVLITVEATDLIFAVDSIPAIFAVTQKAFIVFTSNVFAILGLRSLYFALAGAMQSFRFLKTGLAVVLIFIGAKMLAARWFYVSTGMSLAVIAVIIAMTVGLSLALRRKDQGA